MSFTSQRLKQNSQQAPISTSDYLREYFISSVVDKLDAISDQFVIRLFEDVSTIQAPFSFKEFLKSDYNNANEEAGACMRISYYVDKMLPRDIKPWTDSALKCFDHFLLIYVQDKRKEKIKKFSPKPKERDVYNHLVTLGGTEQEIGQAFNTIYQYRNEFQHVQYEEKDGTRLIKRISNKIFLLKKTLILGEFKKALGHFKIMAIRD